MLIDCVSLLDTTETSHVPTADRVARLFYSNVSDSDSEPEGHAEDALEEVDFTDLAQIRAEVDAIAQGTATMVQDTHAGQEEIEEVDFADLAAMRAKIDAAEPQAAFRDDTCQETFIGVYNQIKATTQVSSTIDVVDGDQPHGVQQRASLSVSPTFDNSLDPKPSIEISKLFNHESFPRDGDTIVIEDEVPLSSNTSPVVSAEEPSLSTVSETHPTSVPTGDITLQHDTPHKDYHPLFVVDTGPTCPFTSRSASDIILVDRTGHGGTLGDQDEERIVYVAPHPRSGRASPVPAVPRVKLPRMSMLTGKSLEAASGLRSPVREDDVSPMPASDRDRTTRAGLEAEAGEEHQLSFVSLTLEPTTFISTSTSTPSRAHLSCTNAARKTRKKEARLQRQNKRDRIGFGAFGAIVSEARLREEDVRERRHPRWETRRKGDSDVDWGTEDEGEEDEGVDAVSNGLGRMEIDPDLELDVDAMQGFLKSMDAEGSRFVTVDDIEDAARMRQEDEEGEGGPEGSSGSERSDEEGVEVNDGEEEEEEGGREVEEEVFNIEEGILIAESEGDEESDLSESSDDDAELSPGSSFQVRLRKVRERSRSQRPEAIQEKSDNEDDEDMPQSLPFTRSADDEGFIAHINVSRELTITSLVCLMPLGTVRSFSKRTVKVSLVVAAKRKKRFSRVMPTNATWRRSRTISTSRRLSTSRVRLAFFLLFCICLSSTRIM